MLVVTMDVTSLYTNIPQEQGMQIVCIRQVLQKQPSYPNQTLSWKEFLQIYK